MLLQLAPTAVVFVHLGGGIDYGTLAWRARMYVRGSCCLRLYAMPVAPSITLSDTFLGVRVGSPSVPPVDCNL